MLNEVIWSSLIRTARVREFSNAMRGWVSAANCLSVQSWKPVRVLRKHFPAVKIL